MKIKDIISVLERFAPPALQESYDNSGLQSGDPETETEGVLIALDITSKVVQEAAELGFRLIISHHPVIFRELKSLTGRSDAERAIMLAIKEGICLYSMHTNLDNIRNGVNGILAEKIGLTDCRILRPGRGHLRKLVAFCPENEAGRVRQALFDAGAGHIGNYDSCSFNISGNGTFRGLEGSDPYVGKPGALHTEKEERIETVYPFWEEKKILKALMDSHPYEEVAYDLYPLENRSSGAGSGIIGKLSEPENEQSFIHRIKQLCHSGAIRHSALQGKKVNTVAVCGGSGSFLIGDALQAGADVFITGDIKYHDFYQADNRILLVDAGHYETEQFAKELIGSVISENFSTFAVRLAKSDENPVNFL